MNSLNKTNHNVNSITKVVTIFLIAVPPSLHPFALAKATAVGIAMISTVAATKEITGLRLGFSRWARKRFAFSRWKNCVSPLARRIKSSDEVFSSA